MDSAATFLLEHWLAFALLAVALGLGDRRVVRRLRFGDWAWRYHLPAAVLASYRRRRFARGSDCAAITSGGSTACARRPRHSHRPARSCHLHGALVGRMLPTGSPAYSSSASAPGPRSRSPPPCNSTSCLPALGARAISLVVPLARLDSALDLDELAQPARPGPRVRWIVLGLRCGLIVLIALALAEVYARKPNDSVTVHVRVGSLVQHAARAAAGSAKDLREKRIFDFINDSVAKRGTRTPTIGSASSFSANSRKLELPPSMIGRMARVQEGASANSIHTYTDIAGGDETGPRILPGRLRQAHGADLRRQREHGPGRGASPHRQAERRQVDVVPIDAGRKHKTKSSSSGSRRRRSPRRMPAAAPRRHSQLSSADRRRPLATCAKSRLRRQAKDARDDKDKNSISVKLRQGPERLTISSKPAPRTTPRIRL